MSSPTIPDFNRLNSDNVSQAYHKMRKFKDNWHYEHDEKARRRADLHSNYNMSIFFTLFIGGILFGVVIGPMVRADKTSLAVAISFMVMGTYFFYIVRWFAGQHAHIQQLNNFGNLKFILPQREYQLGETVQFNVEQMIKPEANLSSRNSIVVQVACYEITRSDNGTTVSYEHVRLKKSRPHVADFNQHNRQLSAQFSITLPQQGHPSLQSPTGRSSTESGIWWLVEAYHPSLDIHAYVPIKVVANS